MNRGQQLTQKSSILTLDFLLNGVRWSLPRSQFLNVCQLLQNILYWVLSDFVARQMRKHSPQLYRLCRTNLMKNPSQREKVLRQTSLNPLRALPIFPNTDKGRSNPSLRNCQWPHFQTTAQAGPIREGRGKASLQRASDLKDRKAGAGVQPTGKVKRPLRARCIQKTRSWKILSLAPSPQILRSEEENTKNVGFSPQNGKKCVRPIKIDCHQRRKGEGERVQVETRFEERPL